MKNNIIQTINPRAKRLSLRVDQKAGIIRLTIPKWTMLRTIDRFLENQETWIADKQKLLKPKINIVNGASIPFMGVDHVIQIEKHDKRTTDISLSSSLQASCLQSMDYRDKPCNDGVLLIKTSREAPTTNLKRWMIDQARQKIELLAEEKAACINKTISKIDLRDPSSRWGSCSTDHRLMFSWRIIMAPPYALDYLVAHEVAHLKHMDHSKAFWTTCYDLSEQPDKGRAWLKTHGNDLMQWF
jgi:predicted metal-dependent hydrolase